jgi:hypothetical protein
MSLLPSESECCNPIVKGFQTLTDESDPAGADLSSAVSVDASKGAIEIDKGVLEKSAKAALPETSVDAFLYATANVQSGGAAILEGSADAEASSPVVVPWVVVSDLVQNLGGTPPELRSALGIDDAKSGVEAADLLRARFANVPDWMLAGGAADLFVRDPAASSPTAAWLAGTTLDSPLPPRPAALSGDGKPEPGGDAVAAARAVIRGNWDGLGGHWWGWPFGWQVAINQPSAANLAYVLTGFKGGARMFDAIVQVIGAGGVSAGVKALSMTWAAAAAIYAAALGANILAVNGSKGVKIQGNWPVVGGPGAFIWAIRG